MFRLGPDRRLATGDVHPMFPSNRSRRGPSLWIGVRRKVSNGNRKQHEDRDMKRFLFSGVTTVFALTALACGGGGDEASSQMADAEAANPCAANPCATDESMAMAMSMPAWFKMDEAAKTVTMDITAGSTDANNHWNFNGYANGNATIVVPQGYTVTINFTNEDPLSAHSIGVDAATSGFPTVFDSPKPVFAGAISPNPTSMTEATASGQSATLTFTADKAGNYSLVCYIPGHAATGMWIHFTVSSDGSAGVQA
jgi:sulfocyanin